LSNFQGETELRRFNRIRTASGPDGSVVPPAFNDANLLKAVDVNIRGAKEQSRRVMVDLREIHQFMTLRASVRSSSMAMVP